MLLYWLQRKGWRLTSQTINRPLFELLKCDLCGGRGFVEVKPVGILLLLIDRKGELFLLRIDSSPPFWVDTVELRFYHLNCVDNGCMLADSSLEPGDAKFGRRTRSEERAKVATHHS